MTLGILVGVTTDHYLVPPTAGNPIPVQMPSGIQAGDELIVHMNNIHVNPVSINGPSGWLGGLSTGWFTKTADGSEDGAVLNWTTQGPTTVAGGDHHVLVIAALAYRFKPLVPQSIFRFFDSGSSLSSSATLTDIPRPGSGNGIVTGNQLRVYSAFGQGSDSLSDPTAGTPLSAVNWTNATDRTGLIAQSWGGENLNDSTGMSVADVEHLFPPPFSIYFPHDAVTVFGGPASTGFRLHTTQYNLPFLCDNFTDGGPLVDYETTSTVVTAGGTADIQMPANVQAGDYLVLMQGNLNENVIDPSQSHAPAGWIQVWGQTSDYEWYKIADGTEGGTTVHFPVISSFPAGGPQRPWVAGVLQYRFTEPPSAIQSLGHNLNFAHSGFGAGEAISSQYGPSYIGGGAYELRVYGFIGYGTSGGFPVPIFDSTWGNAVKRTPIINSTALLTGGFPDLMSFQMADKIDINSSSAKVQLTIDSNADSAGGTGADLFGIRFIFSSAQCNPELLAYWGIDVTKV